MFASMLLFSLLNLRITKNAVNIGAYGLKFIIVISEIVVCVILRIFLNTLKKGRGDEFTKELWIDRREDSKSLAWSSVRLAYHNIGKIGEVVDRPKALGDIRGVSYIYGLFYRFGLIDVPDKVKEKMGGKEH